MNFNVGYESLYAFTHLRMIYVPYFVILWGICFLFAPDMVILTLIAELFTVPVSYSAQILFFRHTQV